MIKDEIRVSRIVLVDSNNNERGFIGFSDNNDLLSINLFGVKGGGISISATAGGETFISLSSPNQTVGVSMGVSQNNGPGISVNNRNGVPQVLIGTSKNGEAFVKILET